MRTLGECPCCGIALEAIENDPDNRFKCPTKGCYFNSNPVPADVANVMRCVMRLRSDTEKTCESCDYSALVSKAHPCLECTPPMWPFWKPKKNAGAVPRRGSDVGTSPLLAVSESGDK